MRASGNDGQMRALVEEIHDEGSRIRLGRASDGGMWGYWFCEPCNNATGRWDETYLRWQIAMVSAVHDPAKVGLSRGWIGGDVSSLDPGGFVRAVWAWAFARNEELRDMIPDVADAVRAGTAVNPPQSVHVMLALTTSTRMFISRQIEATFLQIELSDGSATAEPTPWTVVGAPPFNMALVPHEHVDLLPLHTDIGPLLQIPARATVAKEVEVQFRVLDLEFLEGIAEPLRYSSLGGVRPQGDLFGDEAADGLRGER